MNDIKKVTFVTKINYKIGDTAKISVHELYKHFGTHLNDCTIKVYKESDTQEERFYYDLFTAGCILACYDREEVEVIGIGNNRYFLKSKEGKRDIIFSLTEGELVFANLRVNIIVRKKETTLPREVLAEAKKVWAKYDATNLWLK